jgi:hypothetical protein
MPLAPMLLALVVFDLGTLVTVQLTRELRDRHGTLVRFAGTVAELVPGTQPLPADASMAPSDRMVLAYRLRRPVPSEAVLASDQPYLVPASASVTRWCDGATLLAESGDAANDVALMRGPAVGGRPRSDRFCVGAARPASSGGPAAGSPQPLARSEPRLLVPFGDPASLPAP